MSLPSSRGWGSGWPYCQEEKMVTVVTSTGARLPVHRDIAKLIGWLCEETIRRGYYIRKSDSWGFACRAISGTNTPSNHSWGLAVDINATTNPYQYTLRTDMPSWMVKLWESYGFRWGGKYSNKKDPMHYEFMGTPQDAARYIASLPSQQWTKELCSKLPVLRKGDKGRKVRKLHALLYANKVRRKSLVRLTDGRFRGRFNRKTLRAVKDFQTNVGLKADGVVGRATWYALLGRKNLPVLRNGDSGKKVRILQALLCAHNITTKAVSAVVDGDFGDGTERLVKKFQEKVGLSADGIVGRRTWRKLLKR